MIYDFDLISDVSVINQTVFNIRDKICYGPASTVLVSNLVKVMSIETCEMFLNSMGHLPYIPLPQFNGMTANQISAFFRVPVTRVRGSLNKCSEDSVYYAYSDLALLAIGEEKRSDTRVRPSILTFSNGTRFDETGRKYYVYNARAILYVAVMLSDMERECRQVVNLIITSIRKSSGEWIVVKEEPKPEPAPEQITASQEQSVEAPVIQELPSDEDNVVRIDSLQETQALGDDSIFNRFLNSLPEGTRIIIEKQKSWASA